MKTWTGASGVSSQPAWYIIHCRNHSCSRLGPLSFLGATVLLRKGCCYLHVGTSSNRGAPQTVEWKHYFLNSFHHCKSGKSWLVPAKVLLIYRGMAALNPKHRMAVNENMTPLFFMHFPLISPLRTTEVLSSHFSGGDLKHREIVSYLPAVKKAVLFIARFWILLSSVQNQTLAWEIALHHRLIDWYCFYGSASITIIQTSK